MIQINSLLGIFVISKGRLIQGSKAIEDIFAEIEDMEILPEQGDTDKIIGNNMRDILGKKYTIIFGYVNEQSLENIIY